MQVKKKDWRHLARLPSARHTNTHTHMEDKKTQTKVEKQKSKIEFVDFLVVNEIESVENLW